MKNQYMINGKNDVFKSLIDEFMENLGRMKSRLTSEDLEIAMESLRVFSDFERKRKLEEMRAKTEKEAGGEVTCEEQNGGEIELSMDWALDFPQEEEVHTESVADGLVYSLNNCEKVDIHYISKITGVDPDSVIAQLGNAIYQNPERWNDDPYEGWETADEYLSGNLIAKWRVVT